MNDKKLEIDLYLDDKSVIDSFCYGRDGMFLGLEFTVDGATYNMRFGDPTKINDLHKALSDALLVMQAKLFAINTALHKDSDFGCEKTHELYRTLDERINSGPLDGAGGFPPNTSNEHKH